MAPPLPLPASPPAERGVTAGAAFLMATSAIGPGFLTQTTVFTRDLGVDFAFAILASILVDVAAQVNVWRVLGVARRRGQELASDLVPGLGTAVALVVALGGLAFNVGNIAGCGLGLAVFGVNTQWGAAASAVVGLVLLGLPKAGRAMDRSTQVLGGVMIVLTAVVMVTSGPDYLGAARGAVWPRVLEVLPIVTLVGGTVGGYITFSGVHRLLDAGVGGPGDVRRLTRASVLGIVIAGAMRVLLFLAVLGVVSGPHSLDPANPAASAFRLGAGEWGYRFFGVVLWCAAMSSVVGCSYTSLSFVRTLWRPIHARPRVFLALFIGLSLGLFLHLGGALGAAAAGRTGPVRLLILAGAVNGLILPVTLGVVLVAARRRDLLGDYRHPWSLQVLGWLAWLVTAGTGYLAVRQL